MVVQGPLLRLIVPKVLTEWQTVLSGIAIKTIGLVFLASASKSWMVFIISCAVSLDGLASPSIRAILTLHVPLEDQGKVRFSPSLFLCY